MCKCRVLRRSCVIFRTVDFVKNDWVSCAFGNVYTHKCRSSDPKSNKLLSDSERKCPLYNPEIMPARIEKQIALRARLSTFNWEAGVQELGYFGHIWAIMHLGRCCNIWSGPPPKESPPPPPLHTKRYRIHILMLQM